MKFVIKIWKETFGAFNKHPKLFIPFIITAACDSIGLYILYLAPQRPVSYLLAPPIRRFLGEKFLHYPSNLLILPRFYNYAHLVISATIGVLMTGLVISMLSQLSEGRKPRLLVGFVNALRRSLSLVGVWIVMFLLSFSAQKLMGLFTGGEAPSIALSFLTYLAMILAQVVFIYAMPVVMIDRRNFFSALIRGFKFFVKFLLPTLILTLVPALPQFPVIALNHYASGLVGKFGPETVVFIMGAGIFITFIMDIFLTIPPTLLYMKGRKD